MTKLRSTFRFVGRVKGRGPLARAPEETVSLPSQASAARPPIQHETAAAAAAPALERGGSATRRRVIEAGARVFADLGFHAATKERIGAAAGFSHQTVRDYFRTKEGLLGAIVADAWRQVLAAMNSAAGASPLDQVMAGYDALAQLARARPAEARCVLHEAQIAGPRGAPLLVEEERVFKRAVEQVVAAASGLSGTAASARADVLVASMEALTRPTVVNGEGEAASRYSAEEARQSFRALAASMLHRAS